MEVLNDVLRSMGYYFNALTQFGYKKQGDVDRLIIYNFIEEMLTGEMREFIKESDYRTIERALYCLYGSSCLIPYPQYVNDDNLFGHRDPGGLITPRLTEDIVIRFTEDDIVRFKATNYND